MPRETAATASVPHRLQSVGRPDGQGYYEPDGPSSCGPRPTSSSASGRTYGRVADKMTLWVDAAHVNAWLISRPERRRTAAELRERSTRMGAYCGDIPENLPCLISEADINAVVSGAAGYQHPRPSSHLAKAAASDAKKGVQAPLPGQSRPVRGPDLPSTHSAWRIWGLRKVGCSACAFPRCLILYPRKRPHRWLSVLSVCFPRFVCSIARHVKHVTPPPNSIIFGVCSSRPSPPALLTLLGEEARFFRLRSAGAFDFRPVSRHPHRSPRASASRT